MFIGSWKDCNNCNPFFNQRDGAMLKFAAGKTFGVYIGKLF